MQSRQLFERSIGLLNRLEEHPGDEILVQVAGHLDQWIAERAEDQYWQKDTAIVQLQTLVKELSEQLETIATEIGELPAIEDDTALRERAAELVTPLREAAQRTQVVGANLGVIYLLQFQEQLELLAEKLDAPPPNALTEDALREFLRQVPTASLRTIADILARYADYMDIRKRQFTAGDAHYLKQAVWLRDVVRWASGDHQGDLERAEAIFDWVIRNIDLRPAQTTDPQTGQAIPAPVQAPWETLLLGRGSRWDRAWLFISLLRQLRIEAAVLGIIDLENPHLQKPWLVGVLHEEELYLFSPGLGMPIPKLGGYSLEEGGGLRFEVATLSEVAKNPLILRQLDLGGDSLYPYSAEEVQQVSALLDLSPRLVSQRMKILEGELGVQNKMVLYVHYEDLRERFDRCVHVANVRHWWRPYQCRFEELLQPDRLLRAMMVFDLLHPEKEEPVLWMGRLSHFEGNLTGPSSATTYYQDARLPDRILRVMELPEAIRQVFLSAKLSAGYWLGLVASEENNDEIALDFFQDRTLRLGMGGQWFNGAIYNIGRIYEGKGEYALAIRNYLLNREAPDAYGNRLRAKWIAEKAGIELKGEQFQEQESASPSENLEPDDPTVPESDSSDSLSKEGDQVQATTREGDKSSKEEQKTGPPPEGEESSP